jgi:8-oxo-dGTP diphosphatase
MEKNPKVSIILIVRKGSKILMGKRKRYPLVWGFPGGKLNFNEAVKDCALRELDEEVGIKIKNLKFATIHEDFFHETDEHWISLILVSDYQSGEVVLKEPEKCEGWEWVSWENLPKPVSPLVQGLISSKFNPFDIN